MPTSPKIYASTTLGSLKVKPSTQYYVHFNELLNSWQLLSQKS